MVKVYATGMGPLPFEEPKFTHGSCCRTWHFVRPMLEAGHQVLLSAIRVKDPFSGEDLPPMEKKKKDGLNYILADELTVFKDPDFHQQLVEEFKPDVIVGITTPACRPLGEIPSDAPMWADIHGYVMGEGQLLAEELDNDGYIYEFWSRYHDCIYRADCFSTTSNIQRHTMVGELGALGRINRHTVGHEFVYSIPLARPDEEIKHTENIIRGNVVPQDAFVILWLGGYNQWCDPETLFQGVVQAMEQNPRIHYVTTGGNITGCSESAFPRFKKLVENSEFQDRFHFQGWVESKDVPNYLSEADVGINIDRPCYESVYGARHRIVEMLRAGLPVITTEITEISRDVKRFEAGLCCPLENPVALTACILDAAERPSKLMDLGIQGQELFKNKYTDEVTLKPFMEWLEDPIHAPDWNKEKPRRENFAVEKLYQRSLWEKMKSHFFEKQLVQGK